MDVNIQKYQAFLKAVEYGSFTKAADALSYSQSGISRMIGDLEQEWNIILLERGRGGVRLTSDGLRLLPYAQNVCAEYKKLIEEIDKIDDEVYKLAGGAGSRRGTGGMRTKLQAAALATSQGIDTIITNGKNPAALYDIIEGVPVGTKFKAQ